MPIYMFDGGKSYSGRANYRWLTLASNIAKILLLAHLLCFTVEPLQLLDGQTGSARKG
jgi:hypothetical protein